MKRRNILLLLLTTVGVLSPALTFADNPGYALQFDGASDFVKLAATSSMMASGWQSSKTVSLWVQPTGSSTCTSQDPGSCDAIFGDRPRTWGISRGVIGGQDRIWIWNYDGTFDRVGVPYTVGEWIQIALVHGGGTLTAYKNGVAVGSIASGATQQTTGTVLHFGGIINNSSRNWTFEGQIDEVQIWNTARSAAEISLDMNRTLTGSESGLAAYYRMSNGSGINLTDDSGHGWAGTLNDGGSGVPADGAIAWVPSGAFGGGTPNTPPIANGQAIATAEDMAVAMSLTGSDVNGDPLTFRVINQPSHGSLSGTAPNLTYTPNINFNGADSFAFVANDGWVDSTSAMVNLTVAPVNDSPLANNDTATTNEDTALTVAVLSNDGDVDGDPLTLGVVGSAGNGTVLNNGNLLTYTPNGDFNGVDSFSYTISDGWGGIATAQVTITVNPVNDAPSFTKGPDQTVLEDASAQALAWATGIITGPASESGQVVNFIVGNDNNTLFAAQPAVAPDGTLTYTLATNRNGVATVTVQLHDNGGTASGGVDTSASKTFIIAVTPVNDQPVANDGSVTVSEDAASGVSIDLGALASDMETADPNLDYTIVSGPSNGTLSPSGGPNRTYAPSANFFGSDSFTYQVTDRGDPDNCLPGPLCLAALSSAIKTVTITINAVNDVPSFTKGPDQTVLEDASAQVLAWAAGMSTGPANESGQAVNFIVSNDNNTLFAVQPAVAADGTLTYTLAANRNGVATVTVQLHDNGGTAFGGVDTSAPQTCFITVTPVNDQPLAGNDTAVTALDTPVTVAVLSNDSDVDGNTLTVGGVGTPNNGIVVNNGNSITYTPNPGITGSDNFSYSISDGNGGEATAQVTVTITPPGNGAGNALRFDGTSDFVKLAATSSMMAPGWQSSKTVSLWVKPTGASNCTAQDPAACDAIFGDRPRWWGISRGVIGGQDRIWVWNYDGTLDKVGIPYTVGEWVPIALVHGGGTLTAYKNGVAVGSIASGATQQPNTGAQPVLQFGGIINTTSRNWTFEGEIDEVQIWNTARSAAEINQDMNRVLTGSESGLAAYYQMSDGSGTSLTDDSVNSWTGLLSDGGSGVPADGPIAWVPSGALGGGGTPMISSTDGVTTALVVTNVSTPGAPAEIGFYDTDGYAHDVAAAGRYAYVADQSAGLRIIDVSNPAQPIEVSVLGFVGSAQGIFVSNGYAYVANGANGLRIVNVTDPTRPYEVSFYDTPEYAQDVEVAGNYAYVADRWGGLRIVDISNPTNPLEIGFYIPPDQTLDVAIAGGYAYLADYGGGLRIVNISNPSNPVEVGSYYTPGLAYGVVVAGNLAYVASGGSGLQIVDISNPASPSAVGFCDTPGWSRSLAISGNYAYVADWTAGLRIIDVSNPANPVEVESYDPPGRARDVVVEGGYIYVADYESGLRIVHF